MSITFACGSCGKSFTVDDKFAGKKGKCKQCGGVMQIPEGVASRSPTGPPNVDISPSRPAPTSARPPMEDVYGFEDQPTPVAQGLPAGVEEVEAGSPVGQRFMPRSGGPRDAFAPPRKKKKGSGGGAVGLLVKIGLGVVIGFGALIGAGVALMAFAGLSSRGVLEATLKERVDLNLQLANILSGVNDVPSAQSASPQAVGKIKAIAANLRKLKSAKGLKTDLDALKQQYLAPQEQASQKVVQQFVRIAPIPGAWDALNVQAALEELDREEKSIPGMTQAQVPVVPVAPVEAAPSPPPVVDSGPPPAVNPGPRPGPNPNRPPINRPRPGSRKGQNRPNPVGPG